MNPNRVSSPCQLLVRIKRNRNRSEIAAFFSTSVTFPSFLYSSTKYSFPPAILYSFVLYILVRINKKIRQTKMYGAIKKGIRVLPKRNLLSLSGRIIEQNLVGHLVHRRIVNRTFADNSSCSMRMVFPSKK